MNILQKQFEDMDGRLKIIAYALTGFIKYRFDKDWIITSIFRNEAGSVHKYYRGFDFRITPKGGEPVFDDGELKMIKTFCKHFVYDDNRKDLNTLRIHNAMSGKHKGSGLHGHLQVNSTKKTYITK